MAAPINAAAVAALAEEPLDWRFKGLPASWWGRTPAHICAETPELVEDGAVGPVCVLRAGALAHNVTTMAGWCRDRGVELAPHGKTHMRLVGIAGYEAVQGHDVAPEARANVRRISPKCVRPPCGWPHCSRPTASSRPRAAAHTLTRLPTC